jgi:type II secretory pathway component PulJ
MTRLAREESGLMLIELLLAAALMTVVLGATLVSLTTFERTSRINELQNDNQEDIRAAVDQLSRELRNHAVATQAAPQGIVKLTDYDLVFQTVGATKPAGSANDPNLQRVRYCLDTSNLRNEKIWVQDQTWTTATPPAVPSTTQCPDPAWGSQRFVADKITSRFDSSAPNTPRSRAIFTPNSAILTKITRIDITLFLDTTPGGGPVNAPDETRIDSGIFLRNQNEAPVASFTYTVTGSRHIVLNASASSDPENQSLTYTWKDGSTTIDGTGQTVDYPTTSGSHSITLTVKDPGGLSTDSTQTVTVP